MMMLLISSCSDTKAGWTDAAKADFMNGCLQTAKVNAMVNANDYCTCMQIKVEKKFPDFQEVEELPVGGLKSFALACADTAKANTAVWPENVQGIFLKGCADVAKEKGIKQVDVYCRCVMEGVMYYYPKAEDLANINADSLDKISNMCRSYYEKDTAR